MTLHEKPRSLSRRNPYRAVNGVEYRFATSDDAAALAFLFEKAFHDSGFPSRGIRYSVPKATRWLDAVLGNGTCPHLIAEHLGELVGAISYAMDETFCVEPVAVMHMLYIEPVWRDTAMARVLVSLCVDVAKSEGAVAFHAPIAAEVREGSLVNLFAKGGFQPIGTIMGRPL